MFDINTINKRYFSIKLDEVALEVEPPKIKVLKKITALSKVREEDAMDDLAEAARLILSKNKTGFEVPLDIIDNLNFDELNEILTKYFEWLANTKKSPN